MKTLETWEIIKKLTENPSKKFISNDKGMVEMTAEVNGETFSVSCEGWHQESFNLFRKWTEVKQSVTWQEAFMTDKRVRFENDFLVNECSESTKVEFIYPTKCLKIYQKGSYMYLTDILSMLGAYVPQSKIHEVIQSSKWYIED